MPTKAFLAAVNPDAAGIWNQPKVVGVIAAAIIVACLVGILTMALGAKRTKTSDMADHGLRYLIIFALFALIVGGAIFGLGDKVSGLFS